MTKALLYFGMSLLSMVGVMACGWAYLRHPKPTMAFGRAMVLIAAVTWYAAFGGALAGAAHTPLEEAHNEAAMPLGLGEPAEPDPGQAWPPDPTLARSAWVRPAGLALHVTAGGPSGVFPHYHLTAVADARRVVRSLPDTTPGAHVYGANSGTVGLALACGYGSTYGPAPTFDLKGGVQPAARQIEDLAAVAAEVALKWRLDLSGTRRLPSGAAVPVLGTHRDYALAGGYGGARFDPGGNLAAQLRAKARWYFTTTKAGKRRAQWVK